MINNNNNNNSIKWNFKKKKIEQVCCNVMCRRQVEMEINSST